jgi:hypothetical protein
VNEYSWSDVQCLSMCDGGPWTYACLASVRQNVIFFLRKRQNVRCACREERWEHVLVGPREKKEKDGSGLGWTKRENGER